MTSATIILLLVMLAVLSAFLTWWLISGRSSLQLVDTPNHRSLHSVPVPRSGGIAVVLCLLLGLLLVNWRFNSTDNIVPLLVAILVIAGCSFLDDLKGLSVLVRLLVHIVAVAFLLFAGYRLTDIGLPGSSITLVPFLSMLVSVIFIIWSINMYNFMDGMDGFAAGMTVFGFSTFALLGVFSGHSVFATCNLVVVASVLGFLFFNFPPAKIFLGDTGSSVLGLCFGAITIWGVNEQVFSFWVAMLVFSPFLVDATYTLIRRICAGERFWEAHKSHFYQRLVEKGYGHKKVVLGEYLLMILCAFSALIMNLNSSAKTVQLIGILCAMALYTLLIIALNRHLGRHITNDRS